jgi:rod shape-determining protein MreD
MKKVISFLIIFIIFLFAYFLQANFFNWFNIGGIKPNIFIILLVFIGAFSNKYYAMGIGIFLGLILDFFIGQAIGINAIALGLAGLLGGIATKNFSKDSKMTMILLTILITFICEITAYILRIAVFHLQIEILSFIKIILIEILYNVILLLILYPALQKLGKKLEKVFIENKILTRYY